MYKNINYLEVRKKIKIFRGLRGYTQRELAEKMGLKHYSLINNIETGRTAEPHIKTLKRIADALEVTLEELTDLY